MCILYICTCGYFLGEDYSKYNYLNILYGLFSLCLSVVDDLDYIRNKLYIDPRDVKNIEQAAEMTKNKEVMGELSNLAAQYYYRIIEFFKNDVLDDKSYSQLMDEVIETFECLINGKNSTFLRKIEIK